MCIINFLRRKIILVQGGIMTSRVLLKKFLNHGGKNPTSSNGMLEAYTKLKCSRKYLVFDGYVLQNLWERICQVLRINMGPYDIYLCYQRYHIQLGIPCSIFNKKFVLEELKFQQKVSNLSSTWLPT